MFGSDLSHWDVPDMTEVLEEAWEMVDHEWIDDNDFRDFVFTYPVEFFTRQNPAFFEGTTVEADVAALHGFKARKRDGGLDVWCCEARRSTSTEPVHPVTRERRHPRWAHRAGRRGRRRCRA